MTTQHTPRPTGITVTAWLWIAAGLLMLFSGAMGAIVYSTMGQTERPVVLNPDLAPEFAFMNFVFQYFGYLLALQAAAAVIAIWAGIGLLRLKSWARTVIEALSWLALAYIVGFGGYWLYLWNGTGIHVPSGTAPTGAGLFDAMGTVMSVIVTAIFAVPLLIMIGYLRGREVRESISRAATARF